MINILIFRTDRIGDLIFTCPAIITIKKYFKDSKITLITSSKNTLYARNLNIFDNVLEFPKNRIYKKINFLIRLNKVKFNYIFVFDGKERSILSSIFIKSKCKLAFTSKVRLYYKLLNIKFFNDNGHDNLNEIFQKMLSYCNINSKISNYNFIKEKKDNNFSKSIPIKKYIHIHLDEKWFNNLYIKSYTNINPNLDEFIDFLNTLSENDDILITTGLVEVDLINQLINNFFKKINDKIYYNNTITKSIYLVFKPSFEDIESLLKNAKSLISCHGSITHAANSLDVRIIDIIEKNKMFLYKKFTSYLKNYYPVYRSDFLNLKKKIRDNI